MRLKFRQENKASFLAELNRKKSSFSVTVDDWSCEPKGKSADEWDSVDNEDGTWCLCYYSEDYCIEFMFEMDGYNKVLEPVRYILWQGDINIDAGEFIVE